MKQKGQTNTTRRKALKNIAIGGGVFGASQLNTEKWLKPVVNSVMLPAHAATTDNTGSSSGGVTTTAAPLLRFSLTQTLRGNIGAQTAQKQSTLNQLQELLIPTAHAVVINSDVTEYYLGQISGNLYQFEAVNTRSYNGQIDLVVSYGDQISIGQTVVMARNACGQPSKSETVQLQSVTAGGTAVLNLVNRESLLILNNDPGATPPIPAVCD